MYIMPIPPNFSFVDASGTKVGPRGGRAGPPHGREQPTNAPWVEIHGVKGPDGVARTLYRTGDGTQDSPFMFHEQPPVPVRGQKNPAGQVVIPVTVGADSAGKPVASADISSLVTGSGRHGATSAEVGQLPAGDVLDSRVRHRSRWLSVRCSTAVTPTRREAKADGYVKTSGGTPSKPCPNDPNEGGFAA